MSFTATESWYIQSAEGDLTGPFTVTQLMQLACTGQLRGLDRVSTQEEGPWMPASDLDALGLHWQVTPESGDPLPPCHALALRSDVESERVDPYWQITHLPSGETYDVVDALCSALLEQNRLLEEQVHALKQAPASSPASDSLSSSPEELQIALDQEKKEAGKWKALLEDEVKRNEQREQELISELSELRAWQRKAAERIKALERRRRELEEGENGTLVPEGVQGDKDVMAAYQELRVQLSHLLDSLQLKTEHLDEARSQVRDLRLQLRQEREQVKLLQDRQSDQQDRSLDQLNTLEQAQIQLTRSYRDLNDRFIRLRNRMDSDGDSSAPAAPPPAPEEKTPDPEPPAPSRPGSKPGSVKLKMT